MSVNEVTARDNHVGNGSMTGPYPYTFRITDKTHLDVLVNGVAKVVDTDYTVAGVGASGGGSVTFTVAPATGAAITLLRKQPLAQASDYVPNEDLPAERIEKDLDKVVMALQQDREALGRALKFAKASLLKDQDIPTLSGQNVLLGFDGGNALVLYNMSTGVITGVANPMSATGDLLVGGTAGAPTRVAKGTDGDRLMPTSAGTIEWVSEYLNVKSKGAVGNGVADDRTAIQNAFDAVSAAGGGVVGVPPGTYAFSLANPDRAIRIYPNVTLRALGGRGSVRLKLKDGQGQYRAIFAPDPLVADISGFALRDLTVDQNTTGNPVTLASDVTTGGQNRLIVRATTGSRVTVAGCRFTDVGSLQTLGFFDNGGVTALKDVWITDNVFDDVGTGVVHDHSTVYVQANGVVIQGNTFRSRVATNLAPRTAIETHAPNARVLGNAVVEYEGGIIVTGVGVLSPNVVVALNTMTGGRRGIQLWSFAGAELSDALIALNTIRLAHNIWNTAMQGIAFEASSTGAFRNLQIVQNAIRVLGVGTFQASDNSAGGIELTQTNTAIVNDNLHVTGNIVDTAIGSGIRLAATARGVQIARNTIRNPGQSTATTAPDFRAGIFLGGDTIRDLHVHDNILVDDQGVHTIQHGIRSVATSGYENAHVRGNSLRVADGAAIALYSENATKTGIYVETTRGGVLIRTFTNTDTTPSVKDGRLFKTANAGATTITAFDDGVAGQEITVQVDANTTIQNGAALKLAGAVNLVGTADDEITLVYDGTAWREKCRSVN